MRDLVGSWTVAGLHIGALRCKSVSERVLLVEYAHCTCKENSYDDNHWCFAIYFWYLYVIIYTYVYSFLKNRSYVYVCFLLR